VLVTPIDRPNVVFTRGFGRRMTTTHELALDGDVIVAAQAIESGSDSDDWPIATENASDLSRYVGSRARSRIEISNLG
jgi:hypothetical protein